MSSVEDVKKTVCEAAKQAEEGISVAAKGIVKGAAGLADVASSSYGVALSYVDQADVYVKQACTAYHDAEEAAVAGVKAGLAYAAANPYPTYAALGAVTILALPITRRALWRGTVGRFTSTESVVAANADKVETLKARTPDLVAQAQKLEERMLAAEAEYRQSMSTLRSTRSELTRLSKTLASNQATAEGVVQVLRPLKKVDASLPVRGEAAAQAATLRDTYARVNKHIWRIAKLDI